jgi:hypothetical protein
MSRILKCPKEDLACTLPLRVRPWKVFCYNQSWSTYVRSFSRFVLFSHLALLFIYQAVNRSHLVSCYSTINSVQFRMPSDALGRTIQIAPDRTHCNSWCHKGLDWGWIISFFVSSYKFWLLVSYFSTLFPLFLFFSTLPSICVKTPTKRPKLVSIDCLVVMCVSAVCYINLSNYFTTLTFFFLTLNSFTNHKCFVVA